MDMKRIIRKDDKMIKLKIKDNIINNELLNQFKSNSILFKETRNKRNQYLRTITGINSTKEKTKTESYHSKKINKINLIEEGRSTLINNLSTIKKNVLLESERIKSSKSSNNKTRKIFAKKVRYSIHNLRLGSSQEKDNEYHHERKLFSYNFNIDSQKSGNNFGYNIIVNDNNNKKDKIKKKKSKILIKAQENFHKIKDNSEINKLKIKLMNDENSFLYQLYKKSKMKYSEFSDFRTNKKLTMRQRFINYKKELAKLEEVITLELFNLKRERAIGDDLLKEAKILSSNTFMDCAFGSY